MKINVLEYLESAVKNNPDKILFADEFCEETYESVCQKAKAIGSILGRGERKRKPVAVMIDRDVKSLISFLGVVYSGNFYVPIDKELPLQRIATILDTLEAEMILASSKDKELLEKIGEGRSSLLYEEILGESIDEHLLGAIRETQIDTDPLYAIFTSGSTGIPKGVLVSHRSVIDLVENFTGVFRFQESDIWGNQAPFDFDVSVKDIYLTLRNGGTMQVIPKRLFTAPVRLMEYVNEKRITTIIWAASAVCIVANFRTFEKICPRYLNKVMFSGEVMPNKVLNYWRKNLPDIMYVNLYGPTEITCNCSYYIVDRKFEDTDTLPIGKAFPNTEIVLLNDKDEIANEGELCVRGSCLALGYYNNLEKTAASFCQNPNIRCFPESIYRTGDLAKYNDKKELIFLGRKDFQIKHMGHRIELGEIETYVNAMDFVQTACCLYHEKEEKIYLFYCAEENCDKKIVLELKKFLPKYMWPNRYVLLNEMPFNEHGKMNRTFLREEYLSHGTN